MGQLIFGKTAVVEGQRFNQLKVQTSKEGVPRPIIFGTVRPVVGNVIAAAEPRIVEVRQKSGGKGGGGVETESDEVYRTYAIRICEGPVTAVTKVWRNNVLVFDKKIYDEGQDAQGEYPENLKAIFENSQAFHNIVEFFLGDYDQQPSAVLQGAFGVDEVPPYRGTCYMVVDDENLTSNNGAIPQYRFEVERCVGTFLTSKPYPVYSETAVEVTSFAVNSINLEAYVVEHGVTEAVEVTSFAVNSINLVPI